MMTKASVKKIWGQVYLGVFLVVLTYLSFKNAGNVEILGVVLPIWVWIIGLLFGLKVVTGAVSKLPGGTPTEGK